MYPAIEKAEKARVAWRSTKSERHGKWKDQSTGPAQNVWSERVREMYAQQLSAAALQEENWVERERERERLESRATSEARLGLGNQRCEFAHCRKSRARANPPSKNGGETVKKVSK